jgi:hypothetical protein
MLKQAKGTVNIERTCLLKVLLSPGGEAIFYAYGLD